MEVGVLALQGSFNEHITALRRIGIKGVEIRKPEQLNDVDAFIIPGGESTTMAKLADSHNLFPAMREFVSTGKPVWGTCAGLILLANKAVGQKLGGQDLIGGLDCTVHRNFFGGQLQSFETLLSVPKLADKEGGPDSCRGVFIRAPAILEAGPDVEVLADCPVPSDNARAIPAGEGNKERVIVAVRQGNLLGTAFHPELTSDSRWHSFFLKMGKEGERSLECMSSPERCRATPLASTLYFSLHIALSNKMFGCELHRFNRWQAVNEDSLPCAFLTSLSRGKEAASFFRQSSKFIIGSKFISE